MCQTRPVLSASPPAGGTEGGARRDPPHDALDGAHLVGAEDELMGLVVGAIEDDVIAQQPEDVLAGQKALAETLQPCVGRTPPTRVIHLPPIEGLEVIVPRGAVVEVHVAGREGLGKLDQRWDLRGVEVLDLVESLQLGLPAGGALVLDDEHGQAIDEEQHIQATDVTILEPELLGEGEAVGAGLVVRDERQVALAAGVLIVDGPDAAERAEVGLVAGHIGADRAEAPDHVDRVGSVTRPGLSARSRSRRIGSRNGSRRFPPRRASTSSGGRYSHPMPIR